MAALGFIAPSRRRLREKLGQSRRSHHPCCHVPHKCGAKQCVLCVSPAMAEMAVVVWLAVMAAMQGMARVTRVVVTTSGLGAPVHPLRSACTPPYWLAARNGCTSMNHVMCLCVRGSDNHPPGMAIGNVNNKAQAASDIHRMRASLPAFPKW